MSVDIEAVCTSDEPPDIDASRTSCGTAGLEFAVISRWTDWSNYELKNSGLILDGDILVLWLKDNPEADTVAAALNQRNHDAIESAFHRNWAGAVQCCRAKRRIHLVPFAGNGMLNVYGGGALAQTFVMQRGGRFEFNGERIQVDNHSIVPLVDYESVKSSTAEGSDEEVGKKFQAEQLQWHQSTDSQLTDEICPECRKPMPSYRKSCRFCGFVRGRI